MVLGSVVELPAESCKDIKLSEDGKAPNGTYWLNPLRSGKVVQAFCDVNTEGEFPYSFSKLPKAHCLVSAFPLNGRVHLLSTLYHLNIWASQVQENLFL